MKINVALLEQDLNYQNRLVVAFREKFSEHIEIFQCNAHNVTGIIEEHDIKVLAMSQGYDVDLSAVPERVRQCRNALQADRLFAEKGAGRLSLRRGRHAGERQGTGVQGARQRSS